jgi:hypothetical protein
MRLDEDPSLVSPTEVVMFGFVEANSFIMLGLSPPTPLAGPVV